MNQLIGNTFDKSKYSTKDMTMNEIVEIYWDQWIIIKRLQQTYSWWEHIYSPRRYHACNCWLQERRKGKQLQRGRNGYRGSEIFNERYINININIYIYIYIYIHYTDTLSEHNVYIYQTKTRIHIAEEHRRFTWKKEMHMSGQ